MQVQRYWLFYWSSCCLLLLLSLLNRNVGLLYMSCFSCICCMIIDSLAVDFCEPCLSNSGLRRMLPFVSITSSYVVNSICVYLDTTSTDLLPKVGLNPLEIGILLNPSLLKCLLSNNIYVPQAT
ncbi:hypothetical protein PanWU01x14_291660 [Parasponia andersonii]|uniref:Uncharacterized protein n=1 Tax=Parasponia andersonii TaxID=3476 RepID=A0A2P5AXF2_PARAD|nr:hypothetical protein PanWU01x14_291660 [Parasponia andersonii]